MAQILTQKRVKKLPRVFPLRQFFPRPKIENIENAVAIELQKLFPRGDELRGKVIGVTAPSRGIQQVVRLLKAVVSALRPLAKKIVLVPGIGSHGGGTAEGELRRLAELGITTESIGVEILSGITTSRVDTVRDIPIHCAETVLNSIDGVFLFNRVKEHTDILWADGSALGPKFSANPDAAGELGHYWGVESGLSKMLAVGLAKLEARYLHQAEDLGRAVETAARRLLLEPRVNVVGGLGVVENAYDETAFIEGFRLESSDRFFAQERALLDRSKALLPHLPWPTGYYDLVYVYRAGKDVSGQGVHTKIVGRGPGAYERAEAWGAGMPKICTLVCSTLAGGNAMGRGKFEIVTQRFADAVDEKLTLTNALTSGYLEAIRKPKVVATDRDLLEIGLANSTCGRNGYRGLFMVSTMWMENVWLTESFWDAAQHLKHTQIEGGLQPIPFDADGFIMLPELT